MSDYNWLNNNPSGSGHEAGPEPDPMRPDTSAQREDGMPEPPGRENASSDRGSYGYQFPEQTEPGRPEPSAGNNGGPQGNFGYGSPFPGGSPYQETGSPGLATAALILGICSLIFICCGIGFILGALGIILALLSRGSGRMNTSAKAGLGLSIAGTVLGILFFLAAIAVSVSDGTYRQYMEEYYNYYNGRDFDDYNDYFDGYEDYFDSDMQDPDTFRDYFEDYLDDSYA